MISVTYHKLWWFQWQCVKGSYHSDDADNDADDDDAEDVFVKGRLSIWVRWVYIK